VTVVTVKQRIRPKEQQILIENTHEAIVSQETWILFRGSEAVSADAPNLVTKVSL